MKIPYPAIEPDKAKAAGKKAVEASVPKSDEDREKEQVRAIFKYRKGGGVMKKFAMGGVIDRNDPDEVGERSTGHGEHAVQKRGKTKPKYFAAGGAVRGCARGGGIESRGKTKGRFI